MGTARNIAAAMRDAGSRECDVTIRGRITATEYDAIDDRCDLVVEVGSVEVVLTSGQAVGTITIATAD